MRLFSKILIFMLIVGLIPILTMSLLYFVGVEKQAKSDTVRSYAALTGVLAREVQRAIDEGYRYVQLIAANPMLKSGSTLRREQQAELETVFRYNNIFKDISFLDAKGNTRASVMFSFRGFWKSTSWFQDAIRGSVVISAAHADLYPFDVVITVLAPVENDTGDIVGVVAGQMDMAKIKMIIESMEIGETSEIYLVDSEAKVITSTTSVEAFEPITYGDIRNEIIEGRYRSGSTSALDNEYIYSVVPVRGEGSEYMPEWRVVLLQPASVAHGSLAQTRRALLFAALSSIAVVAIISVSLSQLITRPLKRLVNATHFLGQVDYPITLPALSTDEIGDLTSAFNTASRQITLARQSLQSAYNDMESVVTARTADLEETNRQLSAEKVRAEEANRAKSAFLAGMSHELRTPLNHIIGFTELTVDSRIGPVNDQQAEYLSDVLHSARHLLELINDILDLSKVEAGKLELSIEDVQLEEIVDSSVTAVSQTAKEKEITIAVANQAPGTIVQADSVKLTQIIHNLMSNAVKFTGEGGKVTVELRTDPGNAVVQVTDTGIGIKRDDLYRIFDSFEQAGRPSRANSDGTGLGLALTQRLAVLHGGKVYAESEGEGKGSRFTLVLPFEI